MHIQLTQVFLADTTRVYVIHTTLQVRQIIEPCWFRSALQKQIEQSGIVAFGFCDRRDDDGVITLRFSLTSVDQRARMGSLIVTAAKASRSNLASDIDSLETTFVMQTEFVPSDTLRAPWQYVRRSNSPESMYFAPPFAAAEDCLEFIEHECKKARAADDAGSSGSQDAHILFKTGYRSQMLALLETVVTDSGSAAGAGAMQTRHRDDPKALAAAELDKLLSLTTPLQYQHHQNYDNFWFWWAWKFQQELDGSWSLVSQVRYSGAPLACEPEALCVRNLNEAAQLTWQHALALRKALTIGLIHTKVSIPMFKQDWSSRESSCWMPRVTECAVAEMLDGDALGGLVEDTTGAIGERLSLT